MTHIKFNSSSEQTNAKGFSVIEVVIAITVLSIGVNTTMKSTSNQSGFSLMELVIGLMLITIVTGVSISLLNRFQTAYRYEEAYADAQRPVCALSIE